MRIKKARTISFGMRANILLKQHLKYWHLHVKRLNHYKHLLKNSLITNKVKVKKKCLVKWIKDLNKLKKVEEFIMMNRGKCKEMAFKEFKGVLLRKCMWKKLCLQFNSLRMKSYAKKTFISLNQHIERKRKKLVNIELAEGYLAKKLKHKTLKGLYAITNPLEETTEIITRNQIRKLRKKNMKHHFLQVWKSRAQGPIRKVKAASILSHKLERLFLDIWFTKYRNEVSFFNSLNERVKTAKDSLLVHVIPLIII